MLFSHFEGIELPGLVHQQPSLHRITQGISVYTLAGSSFQDTGGIRTFYVKQTKDRGYKVHFEEVGGRREPTIYKQGCISLSGVSIKHAYKLDIKMPPASIAWRSIESEIEQFSSRPNNWNSYGAQPISQPCKIVSLELVSRLEEGKAMASDVNLTADSDVVISSRIGGYKLKWQIDVDGDIAVMVQRQIGGTSFHDLPYGEVPAFIQNLNNGGV